MCELCREGQRLKSAVGLMDKYHEKLFATKFIDKRTGEAKLVLCLPLPDTAEGQAQLLPLAVFMMEADFAQIIPERIFENEIPYEVRFEDATEELEKTTKYLDTVSGSAYERATNAGPFGVPSFNPRSIEELKTSMEALLNRAPAPKEKKRRKK